MQNFIELYSGIRDLTEELARPLSPEDQTVQSMTDVSPTKWHRAHVTWFFETFILAGEDNRFRPYQDGYWVLFNSYYESKGPRHPREERGLISRPGAAEVGDYRADVDKRMLDLLASLNEKSGSNLSALIELGLHHEQQHQELLLMDVKHVMSRNPMRPAAYPIGVHHVSPIVTDQKWVEFPGGITEIGADESRFAFDSEQPRHSVLLQPFRIARGLVTNREWLAFMDDGGYHRPEYWLSDGWARARAEDWRAPLYWIQEDGGWLAHTLSGTRPIDLDEPVVHVSHYEADAFASWSGARLPTEAEWEEAVLGGGLNQTIDQCWQWTSSAYLPYPGFHAAPGAVGEYNGKFMSNQMVLRGGSCITPPGHTRPTYRNFFPPHSRWAFSGLRLATDA